MCNHLTVLASHIAAVVLILVILMKNGNTKKICPRKPVSPRNNKQHLSDSTVGDKFLLDKISRPELESDSPQLESPAVSL